MGYGLRASDARVISYHISCRTGLNVCYCAFASQAELFHSQKSHLLAQKVLTPVTDATSKYAESDDEVRRHFEIPPLASDPKAKPEEMTCMKVSVHEGHLVRALQEKALARPNNPKGSSTEVRPIGQYGKASE